MENKKKEDEQNRNFHVWFSRLNLLKVSGVFRVDLHVAI